MQLVFLLSTCNLIFPNTKSREVNSRVFRNIIYGITLFTEIGLYLIEIGIDPVPFVELPVNIVDVQQVIGHLVVNLQIRYEHVHLQSVLQFLSLTHQIRKGSGDNPPFCIALVSRDCVRLP